LKHALYHLVIFQINDRKRRRGLERVFSPAISFETIAFPVSLGAPFPQEPDLNA
jgi:hypothetical protein